MPDALCMPHKRRGRIVIAHRIVNGEAMCKNCFEGKPVLDAPAGEKAMPAKKNVDWDAVQEDRDDGMIVADVARKHGVSDATVFAHTKRNGKRAGKPRAARKIIVDIAAFAGPADGRFAEALEFLRAKRASIDVAIALLEGTK
jgi:hypothetical protein